MNKNSALAPELQPTSVKTLHQTLSPPLAVLISALLLLLLLCAIPVMLPPSLLMFTSRAVQSLMSKASMSHLQRVHGDVNTT